MEATKDKKKQVFVGQVVSDKMEKTVVVKLLSAYKHPKFHKVLYRVKKYKIHDEKSVARVGDTVEFYEGRPVSKTKFMYLSRVIKSHVAQ